MPVSPDAARVLHFSHQVVRNQIVACFTAWGMPAENAETASGVMIEADLRGIDSHGISMVPWYYDRVRNHQITMDANIEVVHQTPVVGLIDGGGGLGYVPSVRAMALVIEKAKAVGMSGVGVRNSAHFGAAGYYARMAAAEGLIGFATTNGSMPRALPTFGAEIKLTTNPIAFAAPAARHKPFDLDMATSTVATGKIRNRWVEGVAMPEGWACDSDGRPTTDPGAYFDGGGMTALGGTPEGASYKGYGLAMMVEILSAALTDSSLVTSDGHGIRTRGSMEIGHFFLVIDPAAFRLRGVFEDKVSDLIDDLYATKPVDPAEPVRIAGDRSERCKVERLKSGIPVPPGLRGKVGEVARASNAPFLLDEGQAAGPLSS
jgi:LDH2 family malate/lactate/ureidoglycolate dehydrogenase